MAALSPLPTVCSESNVKPYCSNLHEAVLSGDPNAVRKAMDEGAAVTSKDEMGRTPLHWAVVFGGEEVAKMLLVNTPRRALQLADKYGRTVLHYAAGLGHLQLARVMVDRGATVNSCDKRQVTALHLAAENVSSDMVEFLLSKGADKSAVDARGWLPMHYAGRQGCASSAELLHVKDTAAKVFPVSDTDCVSTQATPAEEKSCIDSSMGQKNVPSKEETAKKFSALEELLNAWKQGGTEKIEEKSEKCPKFLTVESALQAWREVEEAKRARMADAGCQETQDVLSGGLESPTKKQKEDGSFDGHAVHDFVAPTDEVLSWENLQNMVGSFSGFGLDSSLAVDQPWQSMPGLGRSDQESGAQLTEATLRNKAVRQTTNLEAMAVALESVAQQTFAEDASWCTEWESGVMETNEQKVVKESWGAWTRHYEESQQQLSKLNSSGSLFSAVPLTGLAVSAIRGY